MQTSKGKKVAKMAPKKRSSAPSKPKKAKSLQTKMDLVLQRLAMLEPDADDYDSIPPVSVEPPLTEPPLIEYTRHCRGESSRGKRKTCGNTTPVVDILEDEPSENELVFPGSSAIRRKSVSRKLSMVISDDESDEDERNKRLKFVEPSDDVSVEESPAVMKRVEEAQPNLPRQNPSLAKKYERKKRVKFLEQFDDVPAEKAPSVVKLVEDDQANLPRQHPSLAKEDKRNKRVKFVEPVDDVFVEKSLSVVKPVEQANLPRKKPSLAKKSVKTKTIKTVEPVDNLSAEKSSAMKRAEEVEANLPREYPTLVREMLPSQVSGGYWLHLPTNFTKKHMSKSESTVELVDEDGKTSEANYLSSKSGLSGGWRGFSIEHELSVGDVVIFQLISPSTFKVYIVRKGGEDDFDGALGLLTLDDRRGQEISVFTKETDDHAMVVLNAENSPPQNSESPCNSGDAEKETVNGISFAESELKFEDVKCFDEFKIIVDGLLIDTLFTEDYRKKYYELCCSQKSFLHEKLLLDLNSTVMQTAIVNTVEIADAISTCTSSTTIGDLQKWKEALKAAEDIGIEVNFLGSKVDLILENCKFGRTSERFQALESKVAKLQETVDRFIEREAEKTATKEKSEATSKEMADGPWLIT